MKNLEPLSVQTPTAELEEFFQANGYLYFPRAVDLAAIDEARLAVAGVLRGAGYLTADEDRPVWSGVDPTPFGMHPPELHESGIWQRLYAHPSMTALSEQVFGGPAINIPITQYQFGWRGKGDPSLKIHQDHHFNPGINFRTFWVALMDVPESLGGLAIVPRRYHESMHPAPMKFMDPDRVPLQEFARGAYNAGDVVVFHGRSVHMGSANTSDLLRLSIDMRAQSAAEPAPILGTVTGVRQDLVDIHEDNGGTVTIKVDTETIVRTDMPREVPLEKFIGHAVIASMLDGQTLMLRWAS